MTRFELPPVSEAQREFWRSQARAAAAPELARIPARYRDAVADNLDVDVWAHAVIRAAEEAAGSRDEPVVTCGPSLLLVGGTGTGKTHAAYAAMRLLLTSGVRCQTVFTTAADLYAACRPRFGVDSETEFARYTQAPVLFVDDLGAAKGTEWVEELTYRLINHRYEHHKPTLATSNVPPKELPAALGERVTSRLAEMGDVVVLRGGDRRLNTTT